MSVKTKPPRAVTRWALWCGTWRLILGPIYVTRDGARRARVGLTGPHSKVGRIVKLVPACWPLER